MKEKNYFLRTNSCAISLLPTKFKQALILVYSNLKFNKHLYDYLFPSYNLFSSLVNEVLANFAFITIHQTKTTVSSYDILSDLKIQTRALHDDLEEVSFAKEIMSRKINKNQYLEVLVKSKWIYNQLEPPLNKQLKLAQNKSLHSFTSERVSHLNKDIAALQAQKEKKDYPLFSHQIQNNSLSELIGVLYVLEGARLGGKVIVKALNRNSNLEGIEHFHFYEQQGIETGPRWKLFQTKARELITTADQGEKAIEAANRIFNYFYQVHSF
ncbi:MAG: biliverdin-producing heme oxygenase [Saprospiraceae bacterium]